MADESSQDILKPHSYYIKSGRRDLLKQAAAVTAGVIAGGGIGAVLLRADKISDNKDQPPAELVVPVAPVPTPQSLDTPLPPQKETAYSLYLKDYSSDTLAQFESLIQTQCDFYRDHDNKLEENLQRVKEISENELISEAGKKLEISQDSPVIKIFPGIIFVESKGNQFARPGDAEATTLEELPYKDKMARGLAQLLPSTALDEAQKLNRKGFGLSLPPNLYDAKTNVLLGLNYFSYLYSMFPDSGMAVWAYHFGPGNMIKAIDLYLDHTFPDKSRELDTAWKASPTPTPALIINKDYNINYISILTCPAVQEHFEFNKPPEKRVKYLDESDKYAARVGAGLFLLENGVSQPEG